MINYDSILSAFDGKPTLLQWLKMVKKALDESILKNVDITQNVEKVVFTFNFEDGTSISTPEVTLPKGDKGDKGENGVGVVSFTFDSYQVLANNTETTYKMTLSNGTETNFVIFAKNGKDAVNINQLEGKKLSVTGDSIAYGEGYTGGYAKIIAVDNNMEMQNIAVSGGKIVNSAGSFCISESIANMDPYADYAIVEGGFNDAASSNPPPLGEIAIGYNANYDTTTFAGAFENMLRDLVLRYEGKKYGYIAVHQATNKYRIVNDETDSYYWTARKCCEKWGVPFLDLNANVPAFGYFTATNGDLLALRNKYTKDGDGIHLNEEGYRKYYVPKIEAWLKTL